MGTKGYKIVGVFFAIIVLLILIFIVWYKLQINAVNKNVQDNNEIIINIESGTSTSNILKKLKENKVIKNDFVAKIYIKLHEINGLQAGKYSFSGNETLPEVLEILISGDIKKETISITFPEGKNIRYIAKLIAKNTNNTESEVYDLLENKDYIKKIINKYWFLKNDIENKDIYYCLEGYLYPDTYIFENKDVSVEEIFSIMLNQTEKILNKYRNSIEKSNYTVHELLTIASIVELEGNTFENRAKIAQVVYNRISKKMSIGSDVTTYYAFKVDMGERNLYTKEIDTYNAYNTRGPNMQGKLPVGPISNASEESIKAALNPTSCNYLYFVADKNGKIYFANTYEEHQEIISELKQKSLWYNY